VSRPLRLVIGPNFFGAGNFGDDLMLAGFLEQMPSGTSIGITAFTPHDIESQRRRFPAVAWFPDEDDAREAALRDADVWLALGDTPFQLDSGPWMLDHLARERERCLELNVPMAYLGVGCESEAAALDSRSKELLAAATRIWTRDALSAHYLADAAPGTAVETGADLAHLAFEVGISPTLERGLLGLLIAYEREGLVPSRALDDLIDGRPGAPSRWLVQEGRHFPYTERWNYDALSASVQPQMALMPFDYSTDSLDAFLDNYGASEIVISTRYHGTLVAVWQGSRVAVIARSAKLRGIAEDLDLPWTDAIASADDLQTLIQRARVVPHERLGRLRERAVAMCDAFFAWLRER
jgi:hypothetical protein